MTELYVPTHPVRFVSAASLFDGHDAAINIMRRILQRQGAEVVHLGHNRSVDEVVTAVFQEDVQGVAVSSYQGASNGPIALLFVSLATHIWAVPPSMTLFWGVTRITPRRFLPGLMGGASAPVPRTDT